MIAITLTTDDIAPVSLVLTDETSVALCAGDHAAHDAVLTACHVLIDALIAQSAAARHDLN